jgi:hypothetical protein
VAEEAGVFSRYQAKNRLEVDSLLAAWARTVMNFAIGVYRLLGENDKAQVLEKSLIAQNPGGERAAMKRFSEIVKTEGAAQKLSALDKFLSDFPGSKMTEPALAQVAASAIELEDTTAMIRCGDRLLQSAVTLAGANGLAGIAGVFADGRFELNRAQAYAGKALDLARSSSRRNGSGAGGGATQRGGPIPRCSRVGASSERSDLRRAERAAGIGENPAPGQDLHALRGSA